MWDTAVDSVEAIKEDVLSPHYYSRAAGPTGRGSSSRPFVSTASVPQSVIGRDGFRTMVGTSSVEGAQLVQDDGDGEGGDGFDMDEVFGESTNGFGLPSSSFPALGRGPLSFGEEGLESQGSTSTVTARLKRAFEEEEAEGGMGREDGDDEMAMTEDEDEVGEMIPAGRNIVGRRGLSKTQSLPANVFSNAMF